MESLIVSVIQAMLAPGIMISACGLLLLGMNNKYSIVIGRIRSLNDEKRRLITPPNQGNLNEAEENRLNNINIQIDLFASRIVLIQKAVTSYYVAITFFILSSLIIGLNFLIVKQFIQVLALISFLTGMLSVVVGVFYAAKEIKMGLDIANAEIQHV